MRELFADRSRPFYAQAAPLTLGPLPLGPLAEYPHTLRTPPPRLRPCVGRAAYIARGHPPRSMVLAAHLFASTPSQGSADEGSLEGAWRAPCARPTTSCRAGGTRSRCPSAERSPLSRTACPVRPRGGSPPRHKQGSYRKGSRHSSCQRRHRTRGRRRLDDRRPIHVRVDSTTGNVIRRQRHAAAEPRRVDQEPVVAVVTGTGTAMTNPSRPQARRLRQRRRGSRGAAGVLAERLKRATDGLVRYRVRVFDEAVIEEAGRRLLAAAPAQRA